MSVAEQPMLAPRQVRPVTRAAKLRLLLALLCTRPIEFFDRVRTAAESRVPPGERPSGPLLAADDLLGRLAQATGTDLAAFAAEPACAKIAQSVTARMETLAGRAAFGSFHNADFSLAQLCYAATRALRPAIVVETGVGFGVTSAFILAALQQNDSGKLFSIDLPPLAPGADEQAGFLVPLELRPRWCLVRGSCQRELPRVLNRAGTIDLFVHDSLHTYAHMIWEYGQAWQKLRPGGLLISDDVQANRAFEDFAAKCGAAIALAAGERTKNASYGVLVNPLAKT